MARTVEYKGYKFIRTGLQKWDYSCDFNGRFRWGEIEELKADVDLILSGLGLPEKKRGYE